MFSILEHTSGSPAHRGTLLTGKETVLGVPEGGSQSAPRLFYHRSRREGWGEKGVSTDARGKAGLSHSSVGTGSTAPERCLGVLPLMPARLLRNVRDDPEPPGGRTPKTLFLLPGTPGMAEGIFAQLLAVPLPLPPQVVK